MTVLLRAGDALAMLDPDDGCRLVSLTVAGHELLVTEGEAPFGYGSFVMAPWAGRIRDGCARWNHRLLELEPWVDGHAIHGTVHSCRWAPTSEATWQVHLPQTWFGPAVVRQSVSLRPSRLWLRLEVHAVETPIPATVGWHPWFRRRIDGHELELDLTAGWMLQRDPDGIASSRQIPVPQGPWDDAFGSIGWPVRLSWPGLLELDMTSDAPIVVAYTESDHAVCVEPQSGPPDEVNRSPRIVSPGHPLVLTTAWTWRRPPTP